MCARRSRSWSGFPCSFSSVSYSLRLDRVQAVSLVFEMVLTLLIYLYLLDDGTSTRERPQGHTGGMTLMVTCQSLNFVRYFQDRSDSRSSSSQSRLSTAWPC